MLIQNTKFLLLVLCVLCGSISFAPESQGQSRQIPAPPQNHPVVIHGATIHPVSSATIDNGYIVFEKGIITAVGQGEPATLPEGAVKVNGDGLHVYPGLISASSQLGLSEIGDISQTQDHSEMGRVKSEVHAAVAINPDSDHIPVARANGILTAMVMPRGGLVSGRCSAIRLDGWTWEDMTIEPDCGLVINWPRTEPVTAWWMERNEEQQRREIREDLEAIERVLDDAAAYLKAKDADPTLETDLRYENMRAEIQGEKPIFISAALAGQIESAVAWAQRRGLKVVIVGGSQADRVAPLLKKHDIPVVLTDIHRLPNRRHDAYDAAFSLPARLREAGVRFCLSTGGEPSNERNLNHIAGTTVAYGLPADEAL
jgi:imidazolonepropionase-like amidohydrolase